MDRFINLGLIKNPYNWIVIILMVTIFAFLWAIVDPLATGAASDAT